MTSLHFLAGIFGMPLAAAPPEWELGAQLFDEVFAERFEFNVLDATKIIPEEQVPLRTVGRLVLNRVVDNFFAETEQVAFCTQNIVPGIDFSDDPLLQGRNFSYLDTQLKRLGGPNFTHLPVNQPKCPVHLFQQDGHMAMRNPVSRVNYEPNSWGTTDGGPREDPDAGFTSYPEQVAGAKLRIRPESFADHYSQARQFFISQTPIEQKHLIDALVFELSKVETQRIRVKMVGHLRNIDEQMATKVARGLRIDLPPPAKAAKEPITDLPSSDPLSIIKNGPWRFEGRKLGVLMTDGAPAALYADLKAAIEAAKGMVEVIAPQVGGAVTSDGTLVEAKQNIKGGRSVLYDAVALLVSDAGAVLLEHDAASRDFVADAFAHCKFIGYTKAAALLLDRAGVTPDDACIALEDVSSVSHFLRRALPGVPRSLGPRSRHAFPSALGRFGLPAVAIVLLVARIFRGACFTEGDGDRLLRVLDLLAPSTAPTRRGWPLLSMNSSPTASDMRSRTAGF